MDRFFRTLILVLGMVLSLGPFAHAQTPASVRLENSICPVDTAAPPAGQKSPHGAYITRQNLSAAESGTSIEFEVALKMPNFAELQGRVAHGQRISGQEMAATYEPSVADYTQVTAWLTAQGFTITRRQGSRIAVFARGTVAQIQSAMQLNFARVSNGSAEFTSAITAPSVPATLAPLLIGINGLQPNLQYHKFSIVRKNDLTSTNPPYTPAQIERAYNATPLYTSNITGAGQTIAIVIDTFPNNSDLTAFWNACGISQSLSNFTFLNVNNATLPAADDEVTLDTEWSSAIAPGAKIRVYASGTLSLAAIDGAYAQVLSDAKATPSLAIHQMSMSYGIGETVLNTRQEAAQLQTDEQYFAELSAAGVGLFASSGDDGATPNGTQQVVLPASDPNVTGVGGTTLTLNSDGSVNSEVVWNNGNGGSGATGGGNSIIFTRPSWQTGTGVPTANVRYVPDLASAADPNTGALFILNGAQGPIGGTSWSSPTWAAFNALLNQARSNAGMAPLGQLAPLVYQYIGTANFRDITSGNNKFNSTSGFTAGTGYDRCTGVGVPNMQSLAAALAPTSPPSITDGPATSTGTINVAYSFTYTASGTPAPTFSLASGSQLPTGITLSSGGNLAGTPTQSGVFTGTVTASNGVSPNATQAYTLSIDQAPAITSAPISATVTDGTSATFTLTATGYPAPTFTVTSGSLPPGLTLSSSGVIIGTATTAGTFTGVITASNGVGSAVTQAFSITVDFPTDTPTLPPVALVVLGAALFLLGVRSARLDF